jgi:asparagine synthase (glutamine-hydrolysing)
MGHEKMNYMAILKKPIKSDNILFNNKFVQIEQNYHLRHWESYTDKDNKISMFILGKPSIDVDEWSDYVEKDKSYITKILIKKYIENDINDFCLELDGAFTILILDYARDKMILITDKVGMYPVYASSFNSLSNFQIATHPDILANRIKNRELDKTSVAEFIKNGIINTPNTYYKSIKTLENSSYFIWDFRKKIFLEKKYFEFTYQPIEDLDVLIKELSESLLYAIRKRTTKYYGRKAVFLSAGADSRTVLYNSEESTEAITLYNVENTETKTAKEIAAKLHIKHHLLRRDLNHYISVLEESVLGSGGISEITSEHYLAFKDNSVINSYDLLLTGCYFDYMFKGLTLNTKQFTLYGKTLPFKQLASFDKSYYVKPIKISKIFNEFVEKREDKLYDNYKNLVDLEAKRIFPLHREYDSIMRLSLIRFFDWDLISADNKLIEMFLKIPPKYKLNNIVFDKVVAKITKEIGNIHHPEKKSKIGTHPYIMTVQWIFRKLLDRIKNKKSKGIYGDGSWMDFDLFVRTNKEVNVLWNAVYDDERRVINEVLGYDIWKKDKEYILNQPSGVNLFFRILTFAKWHELYRMNKLLKK